MNVEWDENKNQHNKQKHHISFEPTRREIQIGDQPTFDAIKEIEAAKNHEINYEDAPKLSKKELSEFVPANPVYYKPKKQQITLKLDACHRGIQKTGKRLSDKNKRSFKKGDFQLKINRI